MATIGLKEIERCYALGLAYHRGQIAFDDAVAEAVGTLRMNAASASDYIRNVHYIIEGKTYKRTINAEAVAYYLTRINSDLGFSALLTALESIDSHISYYEDHQKITLHKTRSAVADIRVRLVENVVTQDQNTLFQQNVKQSLRDSIADRLARISRFDGKPTRKTVEITVFQRNPDVVAQALVVANGICQRCQTPAPFLRKDGTPFLEVHHIIPLVDGGLDKLNNVTAICPNCHREAHFGADPIKF